jgi:uracil-DNA glycosylase
LAERAELRGDHVVHGVDDSGPFSPHFCKGHIAVAFVFGSPGDAEVREGKPVAGDTGKNLELALIRLHAARPRLFRSPHRYDYRITNASSQPIAAARCDGASEARNTEIADPRNVRRVLRELEDCTLVILGGKKARLLAQAIRESGKKVLEVPHVRNKGLNGTFKVLADGKLASSIPRREQRVQLWTDAILRATRSETPPGP